MEEKLSKQKTVFDVLITAPSIPQEKTLRVAKALNLEQSRIIESQELSVQNESTLKQLSFSMPDSVSADQLEAGLKWDSIKYRAQSLYNALVAQVQGVNQPPNFLRHGYGFEGLR